MTDQNSLDDSSREEIIDGWRVTHGDTKSVFELERLRIEIHDPIRKFWRSHQERLGLPLAEQENVEVERRKLDFVAFVKGIVYLDLETGSVFQRDRDFAPVLDRVKARFGAWEFPFEAGVVGVHAAVLHTNEVLLFTYDSRPQGFPTNLGEWSLLSLSTGTQVVPKTLLDRNLFCAGHCLLGDGRLLVAGGERETPAENPVNQRSIRIYDPERRQWGIRPDMTTGRWYPTVVTVGPTVGLVVAGDAIPRPGVANANTTAEYAHADGPREDPIPFGPEFETFPGLYPGGTSCQYPFVFLLPSGKIFMYFKHSSYILPRGTFDFAQAHKSFEGGERSTGVYGAAVLLPLRPTDNPPYRARVMVMGGPITPLTKPCAILDTDAPAPQWNRDIAQMHQNREFCDGVLLPDGTVLVVNGAWNNKGIQVRRPEIYDPRKNTWSGPLAEAEQIRLYHSTALLLPDATVLTAGTDYILNKGFVPADVTALEVFSPPYLFIGNRPVNRHTPQEVRYGTTFEVSVDKAASIASVALTRNGSVTHSINTDQRFIEVEILQRIPAPRLVGSVRARLFTFLFNERLILRAPPHGLVAPPGYYMLFLVSDKGVPSVAKFVRMVPRFSLTAIAERIVSGIVRTVLRLVLR